MYSGADAPMTTAERMSAGLPVSAPGAADPPPGQPLPCPPEVIASGDCIESETPAISMREMRLINRNRPTEVADLFRNLPFAETMTPVKPKGRRSKQMPPKHRTPKKRTSTMVTRATARRNRDLADVQPLEEVQPAAVALAANLPAILAAGGAFNPMAMQIARLPGSTNAALLHHWKRGGGGPGPGGGPGGGGRGGGHTLPPPLGFQGRRTIAGAPFINNSEVIHRDKISGDRSFQPTRQIMTRGE